MQVIQRYLTLEKFKWLCEDQGFFLAPLSGQSDPQEGIYNSEVPMDFVRDIGSLFPSLNQEALEDVKANVDEIQKKIIKQRISPDEVIRFHFAKRDNDIWEVILNGNFAVECKDFSSAVKFIEEFMNENTVREN